MPLICIECWTFNSYVGFRFGVPSWCDLFAMNGIFELYSIERREGIKKGEFSSHRIDWMLKVSIWYNKMRNFSMAWFSYCSPFSHVNNYYYTVIDMNYGIQWAFSCVRLWAAKMMWEQMLVIIIIISICMKSDEEKRYAFVTLNPLLYDVFTIGATISDHIFHCALSLSLYGTLAQVVTFSSLLLLLSLLWLLCNLLLLICEKSWLLFTFTWMSDMNSPM